MKTKQTRSIFVGDVKNLYRVPKDQWKKWQDSQRAMFNEMYDQIINDQNLFRHPKAAILHNDHWKTYAWNTAWVAADTMEIVFESGKYGND
jgi:hypothetical protein